MIDAYSWENYLKKEWTQEEKDDYIKKTVITSDPKIISEVIMNLVSHPGIQLDLDDISSFLYLINDPVLISKLRIVKDFSYRNCKLKLSNEGYNVWNEYTVQCGVYNKPWFNENITKGVTYWVDAEEIFIMADSKYWTHELQRLDREEYDMMKRTGIPYYNYLY